MTSPQKIAFKNSRNLTLVGMLWKAPSNALVIMAHGSGSNKQARGLFEPIAQALQQKKYNVLTFDFSGHGESDDDVLTIQKSIDDLHSAIAYAKREGYKRFALFGHSLGALTCLKAYSPEIETMVLLGPLTGPVFWKWEDMCTPEQLQEVREKGYITEIVNDGLRVEIKHDGNLLKEISELDQRQLLSRITCPILIIHGDGDPQERDLLAATQKGISLLPQHSELKIIPKADHIFVKNAPQVIEYTVNWYSKYFPV